MYNTEPMFEFTTLGYKCVYVEAQWLLTEYDEDDINLRTVFPIYAPIEDEM